MLKKLFIHEWKDSWRLVTILNLVVLGLTIIGTIFFESGAWEAMDENEFISMTVVLYFIFYVVSIFSLGLIVTLYFYMRFYHNLYTDQGYLMHTLPVTQHQLIWSKTLVTFIWEIISTIVVTIGMLSLVNAFMAIEGTSLWQEFAPLFEELKDVMSGSVVVIILEYIVVMIVSCFMSIFMGYASVSIGQLFKKNKMLGACGVYIGLYMLIQSLGSYAGIAFSFVEPSTLDFVNRMSEDAIMMIALLIMIIVMAATTAVFYCITHNIMKNNLNLE